MLVLTTTAVTILIVLCVMSTPFAFSFTGNGVFNVTSVLVLVSISNFFSWGGDFFCASWRSELKVVCFVVMFLNVLFVFFVIVGIIGWRRRVGDLFVRIFHPRRTCTEIS